MKAFAADVDISRKYCLSAAAAATTVDDAGIDDDEEMLWLAIIDLDHS